MSRNGSGTYTLPAGNPVVTGTTISSTWANNTLADISTALTGSVASDGQTTITGNLKMGANRITGLADGIASTDGATVSQVAASVAGLGTMSTQNANAVAVTGGVVDGTAVGTTTRSSVKATTLDLGLSTQSVAIGQGNASIMKNRIINGAMVIDQRNAGASVTPTTGVYTLDRWLAGAYSASSKFSVQQNAGSVTPPIGFTNYLGITSLSAYSVSASDFLCMIQSIEGYNVADLGFGTANAKTVTLSFWVRSSLTGTFGGALSNSAGDRSYPFTYTISAANTWEQKSITVAGDTSGTWLTTTGAGLVLRIGLGVGSTYLATAGAWAAGNYFSATGATNMVATNGATLYFTGVQLEVGSSATGFDYRIYSTELMNCQRYFCKTFTITTPPAANTQNQGSLIGKGGCASDMEPIANWQTPVELRTTPTVTLYAISNSVSANNQWTNGAALTTSNARAGGIGAGTRIIQIDNSGAQSGSAGSQFYIQATASAEL
jgi:hypothetical protein